MALQHITAEQIAEKGVVSAPDTLTGTAQQNKAVFDRLVGELVAPAYNACVDQVNEMESQEAGIEAAEAERVAAEAVRRANEQERITAEAERVANEQERVQNENARVVAERAREHAKEAWSVFEDYSSTTRYFPGNKVVAGGSSYLCLRQCQGATPALNPSYWLLIAAKGFKGDKGDKGDTGETGPQGPQGPQGIQGPAGDNNVYLVYNNTAFAEAADAFSEGKLLIYKSSMGNFICSGATSPTGTLLALHFEGIYRNLPGGLIVPGAIYGVFPASYDFNNDGTWTGPEKIKSAPETHASNHAADGDDPISPGDIGAYTKPSYGIPKTDLASAVQTSLGLADTALQEVPIASDETLGGIKAGSDFDIAGDGTLSLYKTLTLSASVSPSSAEMGSTIDEVTVSWTLNKTPVSQSVDGVAVLDPAARSKALTDLGITENRTFNVTAADARMSLTRNPGITFYRYVYSKVGSPDASPTQASECVKQADLSTFGSNGADFNYTAGDTLWLLTTKANAQIQTNVLGQWADVTTIYGGTVEFTQANGAVATYHAYNTGTFSGTGSAKYRIR